uniref:Uncharacterized protein n=1 Tax=Zea mays TaxID=4577 RepID=A0A804PPF2_MAIZE
MTPGRPNTSSDRDQAPPPPPATGKRPRACSLLFPEQEADGDEGGEEDDEGEDERMTGYGVGELISACPEACCPLAAV